MGDSRVSTSNVLACLQQVLDDRATHELAVTAGIADRPAVLAVSIDERERLRDVLKEVLRSEDGLLVEANAYADTIDLVGDPADVQPLTDAVERVIEEVNALPDGPNLRLTVEPGRVTLLGDTDFAAASEAQKALRSLLLSLYAVDLRANDLVGLLYAEDALDYAYAGLVWPLLMRLPVLLDRPAHATLLVVAGDGELNIALHCSGDPSLRWRVTDRGLETRHSRERDANVVTALGRLDADQAPLVTVMLGAGASAGYLPTGNAVRDMALGRATDMSVDRHNYADAVAEFFAQLLHGRRLMPGEEEAGLLAFQERLTLERVLREEQFEERRPFTTTLRWFAERHTEVMRLLDREEKAGKFDDDPVVRALELRSRLLLITVNFDQIIERKGRGNVRAFITEDELKELPDYLDDYVVNGGPIPLIKAHGDIEKPDTIVADVTTTRGGLGRPVYQALSAVKDRIVGQDRTPLWYVGYSMRDFDLEDYWGDALLADQADEHWVAPFVDPAVRAFVATKRVPRWHNESNDPRTLDSSVVTLTATDFFSELNGLVIPRWKPT